MYAQTEVADSKKSAWPAAQPGIVAHGCGVLSTRTVKPKQSQERHQGGSKVEEHLLLNRLGHVSVRW